MAVLKHLAGERAHELLSSHFVIGRSPACGLQLGNTLASAEHAAFHWTGADWQVRDLGSRNGTFVGRRRLDPGESLPVALGARIAFGDPRDLFELVDAAAPLAMARAESGLVVRAEGYGHSSILFLPDSEQPLVTIFEDGPANWLMISNDGEPRAIADGAWVECAGRRWRLGLPRILESTSRPPRILADIELRLAVSQYGDLLRTAIVHRDETIPLQPRQHSKLLLALADTRVRDGERARLHESERGWMHVEKLAEEVFDGDLQRLHSATHRARRQFCEAGIADWMDLFERREITREMRLAIGQVAIERF